MAREEADGSTRNVLRAYRWNRRTYLRVGLLFLLSMLSTRLDSHKRARVPGTSGSRCVASQRNLIQLAEHSVVRDESGSPCEAIRLLARCTSEAMRTESMHCMRRAKRAFMSERSCNAVMIIQGSEALLHLTIMKVGLRHGKVCVEVDSVHCASLSYCIGLSIFALFTSWSGYNRAVQEYGNDAFYGELKRNFPDAALDFAEKMEPIIPPDTLLRGAGIVGAIDVLLLWAHSGGETFVWWNETGLGLRPQIVGIRYAERDGLDAVSWDPGVGASFYLWSHVMSSRGYRLFGCSASEPRAIFVRANPDNRGGPLSQDSSGESLRSCIEARKKAMTLEDMADLSAQWSEANLDRHR